MHAQKRSINTSQTEYETTEPTAVFNFTVTVYPKQSSQIDRQAIDLASEMFISETQQKLLW